MNDETQMHEGPITDPQTGVFNRRFFRMTLNRETTRADRHGIPLSMLLLDIDRLKDVNDVHGHLIGDKVLKSLAAILSNSVRGTDFVFRFGGDEFGILMPHTGLEGGREVARRIQHAVENHGILTALGLDGRLAVTIGVAEHQRGAHMDVFVSRVEEALARAKKGGDDGQLGVPAHI